MTLNNYGFVGKIYLSYKELSTILVISLKTVVLLIPLPGLYNYILVRTRFFINYFLIKIKRITLQHNPKTDFYFF